MFEFNPQKALRNLVVDIAGLGWKVTKHSSLDGSILVYLEGKVVMHDKSIATAVLDLEADADVLMVDLHIMGNNGIFVRNVKVYDRAVFRCIRREILNLSMVPRPTPPGRLSF